MTHRSDITWLDINNSSVVIEREIRQSPHLRLPVCDGDLDRTLGILSAKDYLSASDSPDVRSMLKAAVFVPEVMPAMQVLEQFRNSPVPIALVIDEYGTVLGMVSSTDVLEALVGDLPGERSTEQPIVQRPDGSWLIDGTLPIEELKELLKSEGLPNEESGGFQTVAGFVIYHLRRIPIPSDKFSFDGVHIEVMDMDRNRVDKC